jgi:uncharacterized membrane protein YedE/YeeE
MGQRKRTIIWVVIGIAAAVLVVLAVDWVVLVTKAHSSLENYAAFRGCVQPLETADAYATCKLASGAVIKMVKVNNKWYLDGDLPVCYFKFCW